MSDRLTTHATVDEFFHEVLEGALDRQGVEASEPTEFYLVGLLGDYAKARLPDGPLSLLLADASDAGERVRALKEVGDTSLYMTGFFAESLQRKLVGVDYYMDLGKAAYRELAARMGSSSAADVYEELASKFPRFVDVLGDVRLNVDFFGKDVVRLYDQWRKTRSEWVENRLRSLGVLIGGKPDDDGGLVQ